MKLSHKNRGFTLIEAIITITLLALISFGIGSFMVNSLQAWLNISGRTTVLNNARVSMNRLTGEIRRIKRPQNIITAEAARCSFIDVNDQSVDFWQSGTNLYRNNDILSTSAGVQFIYLDANGNVTAIRQDMRAIRVLLTLGSGSSVITLESSARIRNL